MKNIETMRNKNIYISSINVSIEILNVGMHKDQAVFFSRVWI